MQFKNPTYILKNSIGLRFDTIAQKKLRQILISDWSGANWNKRLWKDRELVGQKVSDILQRGMVQGESMQTMARELKNATNQSFNNAFRLIRIEAAAVDSQVTLEGYKQAQKELGLKYFKYDAHLDSRTSEICRELNGKIFKIDDYEIGVNVPPMHPNCRSCTQLILDEDYKQEENLKGQKAIEKLVNDNGGNINKAFSHKDIGDIDLIWGDEHKGLKHIIERRKSQNIDVDEFLPKLTDVIQNGKLIRINNKGRYEIFKDGIMAIIDPNGGTPFLLTAFKRRKA